jgi:FtsH-binding integral membrane protein
MSANIEDNNQDYLDNDNYEKFDEETDENIQKNIRASFIRKVYGVLSFQLVITSLFISLSLFPSVKLFILKNINIFYIFHIISIIASLITILLLVCSKNLAKTVPTNYILLTIFTVSESFTILMFCIQYQPESIVIAVFLTTGLVVGLSFYACYTNTNFTYLGGVLFAGLCILNIAGLLIFLFGKNYVNDIIYSSISLLIFSLYLIYDTQLIYGKFGVEYKIDDYIIAAINIYLDIINLFIQILKIIGKKNNK